MFRLFLPFALAVALVLPAIASDDLTDKSDDELLSEIEKMVAKNGDKVSSGEATLQAAKESQNFQCIETTQEALSAMKGLHKLSQENEEAAQEAAEKGDRRTLEQAYRTVRVASGKIKELAVEMRGCTEGGEFEASSEEGELQVEGEPDAPIGPSYQQDGAPAQNQNTPTSTDPALGDGADAGAAFGGDGGVGTPESPTTQEATAPSVSEPGAAGLEVPGQKTEVPPSEEDPVIKPVVPPPPGTVCKNI